MVSSVPVAQQAMMVLMMSLFWSSCLCFSVCLRMHQNAPQLRFLDKMAKQLAVIRSPFQVTHDPFTIASVYNGTPGSLLIHRKLGIFESFFHRHLRRSTQSWLVLTCIMNFAHADFERPVVQPDIRLRNGAPVVYPYRTSPLPLLHVSCEPHFGSNPTHWWFILSYVKLKTQVLYYTKWITP